MAEQGFLEKKKLTAICDSIRAKTGSTKLIPIDDIPQAITDIKTGGVIEVEELPDVGQEGKVYKVIGSREAVPNFGLVEKIYFNTSMSSEEVVRILDELYYSPDSTIAFFEGGSSDVFESYGKFEIIIAKNEDGYTIYDKTKCQNEGGFSSGTGSNYIYFNTSQEIYDFMTTGAFMGWNPKFEYVTVNTENTLDGSQNELLKDIISINPFEIKYYIFKNGEFVQLIDEGDCETSKELTWADVIPNNLSLRNSTYTLVAGNGIDMYYSYSSSSKLGLYHRNIETGVETQIYTTGYNWQYFYEDRKGNIYISTGDGTDGILHLNGTTVTQIYTSDNKWQYFFEDSKGNVYVSSGSNRGTGYGILHLDGTTATQIYTTGYGWQYFFEDKNGNVYVGSSSATGIVYLNGATATQIYTTGYGWKYFFEDKNGNVYVGSSSTSVYGILHLNGATATKIYTTGYGWKYYFEDKNGNVYVGSNNNMGDSLGILHLNGATATQIYTKGYNWQYFYEDSKGNVYVGSSSSGTGIVYLNGVETATQIYTSGYYWQYFFEDSKGNVYVASSTSGSSSAGILHLNNGVATQIYTTGYGWQYFFEDKNGNVYVVDTLTPKGGTDLVYLNGTTAIVYYYIEV